MRTYRSERTVFEGVKKRNVPEAEMNARGGEAFARLRRASRC